MTRSTKPGQPQKRNAVLPAEVADAARGLGRADRDEYLRDLRRLGWTLQSIADAADLTRERVRQVLELPVSEAAAQRVRHLPHPELPLLPWPTSAEPRPDVRPETLARLLELQPFAQLVRSSSKRHRLEAEEYTRLLAEATGQGVSVYRLAQVLGVTHNAVRARLIRYGYAPMPANGDHVFYRPVSDDNRA